MYIFNGPHQKLIPNNCFAFFMKSDHCGGGVIPFDRYNQFVVSSKPTWKKILKTKAVYR